MSRVRSGTRWTTLVAMISSAGSLRKSRRRREHDGGIERPDSARSEELDHLRIIDPYGNLTQLPELRDLPSYHGTESDLTSDDRRPFGGTKGVREELDDDVGVKIQHPT